MSYTNGLDKPTDYFNTKLYTGNGSTQSITGVGFQPDWTWIKSRTTTNSHALYDAVRGATKTLRSNTTGAEATSSQSLTSFDSDGFSVGSDGQENGSGRNYASWNWKAGGSASSNTDGSITSTVSANTTSGFSIVTYTGNGIASTVGHGLGVVPSMIIVKCRNAGSTAWTVYHKNLNNASNHILELNDTKASFGSDRFNTTAPTSSVFSVNAGSSTVNQSGNTYVAYCFAEKKGFSKFGSYTGNGNNNGTFVYTGFKPAFCIVKRTDGLADWNMYDNKRIGYNPLNYFVYPNLSNAEDTSNPQWFDLLSNGFQLRNTSTMANTSGGSYIYMAFAENPFVTSTGIPTVAR